MEALVDPYAFLGVARDASQDDIKKAYRGMALDSHPDRNPGDAAAARFRELNEAYDLIRDPLRRAAYDRRFQRGKANFDFNFDFDPWFRAKNNNFQTVCAISLEDAYAGTTLHINSPEVGSLLVDVPRGVDNGSRLHVPGRGEKRFADIPPGDLYVILRVMPHPVFTRTGSDLHMEFQVDVFTAMLGGSVTIRGINGSELVVTIPPTSQPGQVFRLAGKGMPVLNSERHGDLLARMLITIPPLTPEQVELLKKAREL